MSKRFQFSPFRNTALKETHRTQWTTLGTSTSSTTDAPVPLRTASDGKVFVRTNGGVTVAEGSSAPVSAIPFGFAVADFDVARRSDGRRVVGAAGEGAGIKVAVLGDAEFAAFDVAANVIVSHPNAEGVFAAAGGDQLAVLDAGSVSVKATVVLPSPVQTMAFSPDGKRLATTSKDNIIRLWDPRASTTAPQSATPVHHAGTKPSKVIWIDSETFLTAGFSKTRDRELSLWDARSTNAPVTTYKLDSSTGLLIPLYDPDSGLLFVTGKGDSTIKTFEVSSSGLTLTPNSFVSSSLIQNAALAHKTQVDVMDCEVVRIITLAGQNGDTLVPISGSVMRKMKLDFQEDLFPDTLLEGPALTADEWFSGKDALPAKTSLNPSRSRSTSSPFSQQPSFASAGTATPAPLSTAASFISTQSAPFRPQSPAPLRPVIPGVVPSLPQIPSTAPVTTPRTSSPAPQTSTYQPSSPTVPTSPLAPRSQPQIAAASSFKYIQGTATKHFEDLKQQPPTLPHDCRLLTASTQYAAWPVPGGGGRIAVWPHSKAGRVPVRVPCVVAGSDVTDFSASPLSANELYTLHEDGWLRVWNVPEAGFPGEDDVTTPVRKVKVNSGKCGSFVVHGSVEGLVVVVSAEIGKWAVSAVDVSGDGEEGKALWSLEHPDFIFGVAVSADGEKGVSVCKDGKLRLFDLRSGRVLGEVLGHEGSKGARVTWLGGTGGEWFVSCGFGKANQREMRVYNSKDLTQTLLVTTEMSPSLITPYADEALPILYLVGKGESYIQVFYVELNDDASKVKALTKVATYTAPAAQVAASFAPKSQLNVKDVEIARCFRSTATSIEQVSFKLPRIKKEFFQDDVYPHLITYTSTTVSEWLASPNPLEKQVVDMCPPGMDLLSSTKRLSTPVQGRSSVTVAVEQSEAQKKQAAMEQMRKLALADDGKLEQDNFEGVAEDEWD